MKLMYLNDRCDTMSVSNEVVCYSRYSIVAFVPCLPHVFLGWSLINTLSAHVVFERPSDGE